MAADVPSARVPAVPLVSVVLPVYNGADVLGEAIDSVLGQTYPRIELVVVNDGSTDETAKVMAAYGDRITAVHQANQGLAGARNAGFTRATGDYIAWADHDDVWLPAKISLQVAFMQEHPECSVVATDFSAFDAEGFFDRSHAATYYSAIAKRGLSTIFPERVMLATGDLAVTSPTLPEALPVFTGRIDRALILGNCLHPPTVMMRRAAAVAAGTSEKRFGNDVDYEYLLRVTKTGDAAFIDYPLIRYRYSAGQLSGDKNLAKIAISLVTVLEDLAEKDPSLRHDPTFARRLATSHLRAAAALAEAQRAPALRHLVRSIRAGGVVDSAETARALAKMVLPRSVVARYRAITAARRAAAD